MDDLILIIRIIVWPLMFLILGALFMLLFKKSIANRLKQLKTINAKKLVLGFEEPIIDISTQQDLIAKKVEPTSKIPKDDIKWNKSGALYWLGSDLVCTIDVISRGASRDTIIHGLRQSLLHLQEVGFAGSHMESSLKQMINDAKNLREKDWHQVRRNWATLQLTQIRNDIGKLAVDNQPGFKHRPDD